MSPPTAPPLAHVFAFPYPLNTVDSPRIVYGGDRPTALHYLDREDTHHVRLTFQGLDALRVCRGEYPPYEEAPSELGYTGVYLVENSPWLRERHAYEARHYRESYQFNGDVDEMLTDFEHYLFSFHDEYVEVLAQGLLFEVSRRPFALDAPHKQPRWLNLQPSHVTERFVVDGLTCQVRTSPLSRDALLERAQYCSVPLYQFALELEGRPSVSASMDVRVRRGETRSLWRTYFGNVKARLPGVATLEQAKALIEPWIHEVAERRRAMGK